MTIFVYLRVSTDAQDVENQKHGILEYCKTQGIEVDAVLEDTASGRIDWRTRKIGEVLSSATKGDTILVAEVRQYKLDSKRGEIERYLKLGINRTAIAKLISVSRPTLRNWLSKNPLSQISNL